MKVRHFAGTLVHVREVLVNAGWGKPKVPAFLGVPPFYEAPPKTIAASKKNAN